MESGAGLEPHGCLPTRDVLWLCDLVTGWSTFYWALPNLFSLRLFPVAIRVSHKLSTASLSPLFSLN